MTPLIMAIVRNDIEALKEIVRPHALKRGPNFETEKD